MGTLANIVCKGVGIAGYALYTILKEGFGFSKKSPMD